MIRAVLLGLGLALMLSTRSAADSFMPPTRFVIDLKPGSNVTRVVQVLQSQSIKVVSAVDMPDGPAVWIDIDPANPPNPDLLRPLLPEVQAYAPDVPRMLFAVNKTFSDVVVNNETVTWGVQAVQAAQVTFGSARKICIIDSGYSLGHPDLPRQRVSGMDRGAGKWDGSDGTTLHLHGTHVAGTIAALGGNGRGVVGVIPGGQLDLFIIRAFDSNANFIYAGDVVVAMRDCADAGANVISMSFGGPYASQAEERMVAKLNRQGILMVAAAGNDGTARFSYPASYQGVLSVAAVDRNLNHPSFSQYNTRVQIAAPGVDVLSTVPVGTGLAASLSVGGHVYAADPLVGSAKGSVTAPLADFGIGDGVAAMAGRICLTRRGTNPFADKVSWCELSQGLGSVIYNNEPGGFLGTLNGAVSSIPVVSVSDVDGGSLVGQLGQAATLQVVPSDYGKETGTSMATPHVSAVAALVWSQFPNCTGNHIREALRQSALALAPSSSGQDYLTGWGLVQAKAALGYLVANPCNGTGAQFD